MSPISPIPAPTFKLSQISTFPLWTNYFGGRNWTYWTHFGSTHSTFTLSFYFIFITNITKYYIIYSIMSSKYINYSILFILSLYYIMPVKFPEFDMSEFEKEESTISHDLDIINNDITEKSSPFVNTPSKKKVYKPLPPSQEVDLEERVFKENKEIEIEQKKERKKKTLSEKQKKHLETMRLKKAQKKIDSLKEKIVSTTDERIPVFQEPTPDELADMEKSEFDNWLKNMSKFENVMKKMETEKLKKLELEKKQELALEEKYRKKFELEQKAKQQHQKKIKPQKSRTIAQPDQPINFNPLQQQETNPYDKYFDF